MTEHWPLAVLIMVVLVLLGIVMVLRTSWQLRDELDQYAKSKTTFRVVKKIRGSNPFREEVELKPGDFFHITEISASGRKYQCLRLPEFFFDVPTYKMVEYLQDGRIVAVRRAQDG